MEFFSKKQPCVKVLDVVRQREIQESTARSLTRKLKVTSSLLDRLGLEKELEGHHGCVNCLEWNEKGTILASASDDVRVILWDPFTYKQKLNLQTGHAGNIFTVKFMPKSNDSILVTGAGDGKVRVHNIAASDLLLACKCHFGRVKRVATAPSVPFLFWSASEDGFIMQYDLREPHSCKTGEKTVLINLSNHVGRFIEAKCISVNSRRPELLAVGGTDAYVRMFDRRMIKLLRRPISVTANSFTLGRGDPDNNVPLDCGQYFIAGHLKHRNSSKRFSTTYLTFSDDGTELLANMGGEQIYLFDINNHKNTRNFIVPVELEKNKEIQNSDEPSPEENKNNPKILENLSTYNVTELSPEVEKLKQKANQAFEEEHYSSAVSLYNEAISLCPYAATLYGNRAGTFMKRAYDGDYYDALRDCRLALALDPEHVKAHFRLARCLFDLNRVNEARIVMDNFKEKFPDFANNLACKNLRKDIKDALSAGQLVSLLKQASERRISDHEKEWRENAIDFQFRLCGHDNTITDIKEANFFGDEGQYIVAGSDDGSFVIWDRYTTNIVRLLNGDQRIVNCLQPHPSLCLLATSGIDPVVRLWSPLPEDGSVNFREVYSNETLTNEINFMRTSNAFLELMLYNMERVTEEREESIPEDASNTQPLNCRPS